MGKFLGNYSATVGIMQMTRFVVIGVQRFREREGMVIVSVNWKH